VFIIGWLSLEVAFDAGIVWICEIRNNLCHRKVALRFTQIAPMIDALTQFLAVATAGSFSQVAKDQGVAVSSVTRKIEGLEAELGTRLFNRSSRRVLLTDAGEQLLPRARSILAEVSEARQSLASLNAEPRGVMSVTAPATFGRLHVAPAVVSFLERYPLLEVDLHVGDQYIDLAERHVDVAIRIGALADSDLVAIRLAPMRLVACASPAYLARRGRPATPDDLPAHNCIDVATGVAPAATWCFEGWNGGEPYAVRGSLRVDDKDCMRDVALAGAGIVHIASWLVNDDIAAGRLVALFPGLRSPYPRGTERAIHAVRMRGRSHDAKARLFIDHLRGVIGEVPYWDR
jgi:DNA-binding transcriptional LysR family regulator